MRLIVPVNMPAVIARVSMAKFRLKRENCYNDAGEYIGHISHVVDVIGDDILGNYYVYDYKGKLISIIHGREAAVKRLADLYGSATAVGLND